MADGYRCSRGHAWSLTEGAAATACPVCGDTTVVTVVLESSDHAPTLEFRPPETPNTLDPADPSFSSLVVLLPEQGSSSDSVSGSSVVPFGVAETVDFAPPLVPGYEIVREVGRGGMGVVYKARQTKLNRLVALKMILSGSHAGPTERDRFNREAEAVAALQHPHIVQIFDIGEANGHPYLALEFVDGGSLAVHLSGQPWDTTRAAELIEILARTMQFAHGAGIVHRDLKPGNILLAVGSEGTEQESSSLPTAHSPLPTLRPKVTDFGLAKRLDETLGGDGGTRTGAVMGTPSYIAPEQASGKARDVGPATDVYALGAILYELITGRPPFRGETPLDTVLQVLHDDPVPPKRLHPLVPRDLETICLKCLSKSPAKRYASAAALADDLRRFLNGEPIHARPLSAWGRGVKWARRHPALAVLLTATIAATIALVSVLSVSYARVAEAVRDREREAWEAQQARDRMETEKRRAEQLAAEIEQRRIEAVLKADELKQEAERTRRAAYALQLAQVAILCERDPVRAAMLLEDESRCPKDLRDFTWHYLRRLCQRDDRGYLDHQPNDPLRAVAYSPAGTLVATAGDAGTIRMWDPRTGRTWMVLAGHTGAVHGLAFSPDGTVLASAGADHTVRLWALPVEILDTARKTMNALPWLRPFVDPLVKVPTLTPMITLTDAHADEATCLAFSPDARFLVSGGKDGKLTWWNLAGWRPVPVDVAGLGGPGATAAALAQAAHSPEARAVWPARQITGHSGGVLCVVFSADGRYLVSGGNDRRANVYTGNGSNRVRTLPLHADAVRAVAVSPDGERVATVNNGESPTVRLFDTRTWRERRLFGHTRSIFALAFSDDGELLASAGFDKTVRLWEAEDGRERGHLIGHTQQVNALAFAPDRRTIVSAGMDGLAVVWQTTLRTHEPEDLLRFARDPLGKVQGLTAVAIGGGGSIFLATDDLGYPRMVEADYIPGGRVPPRTPGPLALTRIPFSYLPTWENFRAAAVSPDGRKFVAAADTGLFVWRLLLSNRARPNGFMSPRMSLTRPAMIRTPRPVHTMTIDPTGQWLATADPDGVRLYDLRAVPVSGMHPPEAKLGELILPVAGAREVAFHPTRDWLAVAIGGGFRIIARNGKVLANLPTAHHRTAGAAELKPNVESLAFDGSGELLATGDASGRIKLWALDTAGTPRFVRELSGHTSAVFTLAFSPDRRTLASGGDDRTVILWDPLAGRERLSLTGHADRVVDLAFNPGGTALVTVSRDGAVKRWRADVRPTSESDPRLPQPLTGG